MDEDLAIRHAVAESTGQRDRMRGSLYVQSDPNFVYRDVKALLEKGRFVLFVGTPCQVYGLKRFLNRKYDNLILVDFLCHGVPSASLLRMAGKTIPTPSEKLLLSLEKIRMAARRDRGNRLPRRVPRIRTARSSVQ